MGKKKYEYVTEVPKDYLGDLEQHVIDTVNATVGSGRKTVGPLHIYRILYEGEWVLTYCYLLQQRKVRSFYVSYYTHFILDDEGTSKLKKHIVTSKL